MIHILLDFDGRSPVNAEFRSGILAALAADNALDVIRWVNQIKERTQLRHRISRLARIVAEQADADSNPTSVEILRDAAGRIVSSLVTVRERLHFAGSAPVCLQGSLLQHCGTLTEQLSTEIYGSSPDMQPVKGIFRPVVGATSLALKSIGRESSVRALRKSASTSAESTRSLLMLDYGDTIDKMLSSWRVRS